MAEYRLKKDYQTAQSIAPLLKGKVFKLKDISICGETVSAYVCEGIVLDRITVEMNPEFFEKIDPEKIKEGFVVPPSGVTAHELLIWHFMGFDVLDFEKLKQIGIMKDAFYAARLTHPVAGMIYDTFDDYLKSVFGK